MSLQLQQFEHDRCEYDRPDQPWVCGKSLHGESCRTGPDQRGNCRATTECVPVRKGDRWICTRTPMAGGKCEDGPLPDGACACRITPCQPVRSQRSRRNLAVSGTVAFVIGMLLLLGAGRFGPRFFSPGPLSLNHAELETKCASCHTAGRVGAGDIVALAVEPPEGHDESSNCLACHNFEVHARAPHSLPPSTLTTLIREAEERPATGGILRTAIVQGVTDSAGQTGDVACATCHREHQGRMVDLTRMDPVQCQSCHQNPFASFPEGHPEFSADYPTRRRTRIAFNHKGHIEKGGYFEQEGFTAQCDTCHVPDPTGARMLVQGFEQTCGGCHHHRNQIAGLTSDADFDVFCLPAVDLDTLRKHGIWIGDGERPWPVDGAIETTPLTPFMRLLLTDRDRPQLMRDLAMFKRPDEMSQLKEAKAEKVAAAGRVVWAIKRLVLELTDGGTEAFEKRLRRMFDQDEPLPPTEISALIGQPADAALAPQQTWHHNLVELRNRFLPDLEPDVRAFEANPSRLRGTPPAPEPEAVAEAEAAPAADDALDALDEDLLGDDDLLGGGDDDLLGGGDDDLLGGGDDDLLGGGDDDLLGGGDGDLLGGGDDLLGGADAPDENTKAAAPLTVESLQKTIEALGKEHAEALEARQREFNSAFRETDGWRLDDFNFAVAYRPAGHANPFLRAWLERTSDAGDGALALAARKVFDELRADQAPGRCVRCHSVDEDIPTRVVNWAAERPYAGLRHFTRFDHGVHFNFDQFKNCTACHSLDSIGEETVKAWNASYADGNLDPAVFAPSFGPIRKGQCVECHTPDGAGDGCLSCHHYHVGDFPFLLDPPTFGAAKDESVVDAE